MVLPLLSPNNTTPFTFVQNKSREEMILSGTKGGTRIAVFLSPEKSANTFDQFKSAEVWAVNRLQLFLSGQSASVGGHAYDNLAPGGIQIITEIPAPPRSHHIQLMSGKSCGNDAESRVCDTTF